MIDIGSVRRAAIVAPHPDDEVLGCGGTMARLAAGGCDVHAVIVTRGTAPRFDPAQVKAVRAEARAAHRRLGVANTHFLDLPAAELDRLPQADVNAALGDCLTAIAPDILFIPFVGDIHIDHQIAFTAALVWARPRNDEGVRAVFAYETLSETNWLAPPITPAFVPNMFVDITDYLAVKLASFACFSSQIKPFPDERSPEAIHALATIRGATVHRQAAEGFMTIRQVI